MKLRDASAPPGPCPTDEEIAAFLDGTLPAGERDRVAGHLASCERCYTLFSGTADLLHEVSTGAAGKPGGLLPFPFGTARPSRTRWLVSLAALLVIALGLGLLSYRAFFAQPEVNVAELLEPVRGQEGLAGNLFDRQVLRGNEDGSGLFADAPSFMAGVFLVDLRIALRAGDAEEVAQLLQAIGLKLAKVPFTDEPSRRYLDEYLSLSKARESEDKAEAEALLRNLAETFPEREQELASEESLVDGDFLAFGKWAEAARIAAAVGQEDFFERRENRRFLSWILRQEELFTEEEQEPVVDKLRQIQDLWTKDPTPADFQALQAHFAEIIRWYDESSTPLY